MIVLEESSMDPEDSCPASPQSFCKAIESISKAYKRPLCGFRVPFSLLCGVHPLCKAFQSLVVFDRQWKARMSNKTLSKPFKVLQGRPFVAFALTFQRAFVLLCRSL